MSATIAIVGRPNVGKSTLFNRLVGKRLALVDDRPGVTRDRREGEARLGDLRFSAVDTAGFEEAAAGSLPARMRAQTETALADADIILLVIDARVGVTPMDRAFAEVVRKQGKPTVVIANKSEGRDAQTNAMEAYSLGLGEPIALSAEHGEGTSDLYEALSAILSPGPKPKRGKGRKRDSESEAEAPDPNEGVADAPSGELATIRVAVVGRPNSGKSTLINTLLGEDRLLTGPEAGITRDAIAVEVVHDGRIFRIHDTAGMRRKARIEEKLEKLSVADTLRAIRFAEVVIVLMDAERPFEEQDLRIADLVLREGRALVLGMNKWDLVEQTPGAIGRLRTEADHLLPQAAGVPIVATSGLHGQGLDRLLQAVVDIHVVWNRRVPTAALNRWLEETVSAHAPPAVSGRRIRLNYMTQPKARPPSFVLFSSRADAVPEDYRRYLVNSLREAFDLPGTPIRLTLREKENPYAGKAKPRS